MDVCPIIRSVAVCPVAGKRGGPVCRDLRDLDGVRQPVAEVVGVAPGENLSLRFQAAKSAGMDNTIAIALKVVAVGMLRLGMAASAGVFYAHRVVGEHEKSLALFILDCRILESSRESRDLLHLAQLAQHFRSLRNLRNRGGNLSPTLSPVFVDHESRAEGDIGVPFAVRVEQPILTNHT